MVRKVKAAGATCVLCTPSTFDSLPMRKAGKLLTADAEDFSWKAIYEGYDGVMSQYAQWVLAQREKGIQVIDLHGELSEFVASKRLMDPDFAMSGDGIHYNDEGHRVVADAILKAFSWTRDETPEPGLVHNVSRRQRLMRDAWLTEVGHKRPNVKAGLPLAEAREQASKLP